MTDLPGANAPGSEELERLIEPLRALVLEAGEIILGHYSRLDSVGVSSKADHSPLTDADLAAHERIDRGLRQIKPALPILSEESKGVDLRSAAQWPRYWLVDPLDGTREFLKATDDFTVNIALVDKAKAVVGIVYAPVTRQCFWAWRGGGAWMSVDSGPAQRIRARKWNGEDLDVVVSRSHPSAKVARWLDSLPWPCRTVPVGSSLKLCIIAKGEADAYPRLGDTSLWDIAAADCVVSEAGGLVCDLDGDPLAYQPGENILNPYFLVRADTRLPGDVVLALAKEATAAGAGSSG